ncbi:MAG TPA: carbamoyltransferase C-terminal domain-containing protein [Verrucomicrobiae bacterium]|nr:carbamoyltransferase C-terminal domain-containing protein [Verrucomicrobiae bacterium]
MHVLGLSALNHDPSAAIVNEHGLAGGIEEGKLVRVRSFSGIPRAAIQFCLERAGTGWGKLDLIAIASRPYRAFVRKASLRGRLAPIAPVTSAYYLNKALGELGVELNNLRILREMAGAPAGRVAAFDHHACHAASAFYGSAFDSALIVTLDESGDGQAGSVSIGEGTRIREIVRLPYPHSLGLVFAQFSRLLGFRKHGEEHKTQWLSLSGEPAFAELLTGMLRRKPGEPPRLSYRYFQRDFAGGLSFTPEFYRRIGISGPDSEALSDGLRANLAASLQQACAAVVAEWVESLRQETGAKHLCLAGGVFLNPLLAASIERQTQFEEIFIQPAAGNEGTSLGAAWLAWHGTLKQPRTDPMHMPFWGPKFSNEEIKNVLDNCKATYRWCDSADQKVEEAMRLLRAGKIIGWYQGAAEFGPRALGHRSLLASPWAPYAKENLNDYVKHRESFRPFALAVPAEDAATYFQVSANARFLSTMAVANPRGRAALENLPNGFLLRNNQVRLQTVAQKDDPLFWKLLKRSGENSPAPFLVNTSFNLFGEPLVITPRDAVRSYFCSGADALFAGSFFLSKG